LAVLQRSQPARAAGSARRERELMAKRLLHSLLRQLASNWYAKLSFLFAAILFWQWFDSLEGYWWPETFAVVHGVLIASVAIEALVPGARWIRLVLHAV